MWPTFFHVAVSLLSYVFHSGDERNHSAPSDCITSMYKTPHHHQALFQFGSPFQCTEHLYSGLSPGQVPQIHKYQPLAYARYEHSVARTRRWWLLSPGVLCNVNIFPSWVCFKKPNIYFNNYHVTSAVLIYGLYFLQVILPEENEFHLERWRRLRGAAVPRKAAEGCGFGQNRNGKEAAHEDFHICVLHQGLLYTISSIAV